MQLSRLTEPEIDATATGLDPDIRGITADSRAVEPGFLFAALAGSRTDGAKYLAQAVAKGAAAVLVGTEVAADVPAGVAVVRSQEPRRALALMAARFYPRQPATIVAITGTNGKTSIAEFTRQIFAHLGHKAASLGTIGVVKPGGAVYGSLTTPDPVALHRTLQELADEGVTHLALEASSHGLDQFRLDGVRLTAGAFNNLGRDHLDYHPTMEAYLSAKLRLWGLLQPGQTAVINQAFVEPNVLQAVHNAAAEHGLGAVTVGFHGSDFEYRQDRSPSPASQAIEIGHKDERYPVRLDLVGGYQAQNALVAAALAIVCGESPAAVFNALSHLKGVAGRLETVTEFRGGLAIVDYAHKPEALAAALSESQKFMSSSGKLICVVGCGGDRDKGKRPIMGRIARELSDVVLVTDDNPRTEQPEAVRKAMLFESDDATAEAMKAIKAYLGQPRPKLAETQEVADRAEAIRAGVAMLGPGDVLLVAGKGHETGQIVGDKVLPFSDHEEILKAVKDLSDG